VSASFEERLDPDPFAQFERWFAEAQEAGVAQAEAMAVATAGADGQPSVRMVLMKEHGPEGFVFYTNYGSRKGGDLAANPRAALLFFWQPQGRQVRIEGPVEAAPRAMSERYHRSRPPRSQVAAAISHQSRPVGARAELEDAFEALLAATGEEGVPLPAEWGGYRVRPAAFEFWEHRDDRLHDRLRYEFQGGAWSRARLAP
jgi:pyridoxamine 5'-phosphate oxidase